MFVIKGVGRVEQHTAARQLQSPVLRCREVHGLRAAAEAEGAAASAELVLRESTQGVVLPRAPRAGSCPRFVRRSIATRLPELCDALMERALSGDLQATKLLWQMAELDRKPAGSSAGKRKTDAGLARRALAEFRAR